ncbi:hypothetical protein [Trinickia mobilis]|uniref:hypothetical protein n=1 Tax=Trinickia mobilis TaxID=2816356 RepID=UPI001A8D1DB8|nr:hypothetical protein [Trinickia mobilis]
MSIYISAGVGEVPQIYLECWSIRQTRDGDRHFVGFNIANRDGRVSSRIVELDCTHRVGVTTSGRRYRLLGRAGYNSDAEYVWNWYLKNRGIESWEDVTPILIPDWRRGIAHFDEGGDLIKGTWARNDEGTHGDAT